MDIFDEVETLENKQEWQTAKDTLFKQWNNNKDNLSVLIRIGTLCWYVLVFWERIRTNDVDKIDFNNTLDIVTNYGIDKFNDNTEFLWIFGYMILLFPYYFGDYCEYEYKGKKMIEKAHNLNPNDPLITMLFLNDDSHEYKVVCREVANTLMRDLKKIIQ